ncbi:MAG: molybdenum cofactor guanylyltransferase [Candidatus Latescibacterota bacterium]|nr:MAG: molybdenum cofactor guanylyltransferase [Candidatus Latescibacterota bacterium]
MSTLYPDITGYILAGGRSRRFGKDKRQILIGGISLLEKTRRLLVDLLGREPFVVGDNLSDLVLDPSTIVPDSRPGCGPLGGLVAALSHSPTVWSLVMAADMPFLTIEDLRRLADARAERFDVVALSRTGAPEPLAALYHIRRLHYWHECLDSGLYSLAKSIKTLDCKTVILGASSRSLQNINTPDVLDVIENDL